MQRELHEEFLTHARNWFLDFTSILIINANQDLLRLAQKITQLEQHDSFQSQAG